VTISFFIRDAAGCDENVLVTIEPGVNLNATVETVYGLRVNTLVIIIKHLCWKIPVANGAGGAWARPNPADMQLNPFFRDTMPGSHYIAISSRNGLAIVTHSFEAKV
jgi:hypothetical protein